MCWNTDHHSIFPDSCDLHHSGTSLHIPRIALPNCSVHSDSSSCTEPKSHSHRVRYITNPKSQLLKNDSSFTGQKTLDEAIVTIDGGNSPNRQVGVMVKDIAIGARGPGFCSRARQIGHIVANGSPPLRCFFGAVLSRR